MVVALPHLQNNAGNILHMTVPVFRHSFFQCFHVEGVLDLWCAHPVIVMLGILNCVERLFSCVMEFFTIWRRNWDRILSFACKMDENLLKGIGMSFAVLLHVSDL